LWEFVLFAHSRSLCSGRRIEKCNDEVVGLHFLCKWRKHKSRRYSTDPVTHSHSTGSASCTSPIKFESTHYFNTNSLLSPILRLPCVLMWTSKLRTNTICHYESYSTHLCIEPRRQQIGTSRGETDKNQLDLTAESNLRDFASSLTSSCSLIAGINYISVGAHYRSQPKDTMQLLSSLP
jgi:hypothetical protein